MLVPLNPTENYCFLPLFPKKINIHGQESIKDVLTTEQFPGIERGSPWFYLIDPGFTEDS